jgi:RimJ/RimL family protein N-acetyltransferase
MSVAIQLETPRLLLRQWKSSDVDLLAKISSDPVVMEHFVSMPTHEQIVAMVARINECFETKGYGLFAVEIKDSGEFIGFVGLWDYKFESKFTPCIEVGWRLAKEHWGKGYAPEAARRVLQFGFEEVKLAEIFSWTSKFNTNSIRVMEKIGLRRDIDNDFDHPSVPEGHRLRPHVFYRLKASEFSS